MALKETRAYYGYSSVDEQTAYNTPQSGDLYITNLDEAFDDFEMTIPADDGFYASTQMGGWESAYYTEVVLGIASALYSPSGVTPTPTPTGVTPTPTPAGPTPTPTPPPLPTEHKAAFIASQEDSLNSLNRFFDLYSKGGNIIPTETDPTIDFVISSYDTNIVEVWNLWNLTLPFSSRGEYFKPGLGLSSPAGLTSSYYEVPVKANYQFLYDFNISINATVNPGEFKAVTGSFVIEKISNSTVSVIDSNDIYMSFTGQAYRANLGRPFTGYSNIQISAKGQQIIPAGYYLKEYESPLSTNPITTQEMSVDAVYKGFMFSTVSEGEILDVDMGGGEQVIINLGTYWVSEVDAVNIENNWMNVKMYSDLFLISDSGESTQNALFKRSLNVEAGDISVGDIIHFRFLLKNTDVNSVTINEGGFFKVIPSQGTLIAKDINICVDQQLNAFYLDTNISPFFNLSYYFDPTNPEVSSNYSYLYSLYGDILYPFFLEENDKIIIQAIDSNGPVLEYNVSKVEIKGENGLVYIYVKEDINAYFSTCNKFYKILFLKRVVDETSIIVNMKKQAGKTSYGFSIPVDVNPKVLNNIDNINKNVNKQLIDAGLGTVIN